MRKHKQLIYPLKLNTMQVAPAEKQTKRLLITFTASYADLVGNPQKFEQFKTDFSSNLKKSNDKIETVS